MPQATSPPERCRARATAARGASETRSLGRFSAPSKGYLGLFEKETERNILMALSRQGPMLRRQMKKNHCSYVSRSAFGCALRSLTRAGLLCSRPWPDDKREKLFELTPDAEELLQIALEVSTVEARASLTLRSPDSPSLMSMLAHEYARMIPPAMLDKEQTHTQLRTRLPTISETAFDRHLSLLVDCGLVRKRSGSRSKKHTYELTELVPALVRPLARAARLRIRMTPHDARPQTGDLPSYIELLELGGSLRAPREARGVVQLRVIPCEGEHGWRDIEVALGNGHISPCRNGNHPLCATMRATPLAWWNAILDEDLSGVEIEDDVKLAHILLAAISAAVNASARA